MVDIHRFLTYPKTQKGVAINCVVAGAILIVLYFGSVGVSMKGGKVIYFSLIPANWKPEIIIWIAATLIFAASNLLRKIFLTPEVINAKCPYCQGKVETFKLRCLKCHREL
jgi:hypothetical protein